MSSPKRPILRYHGGKWKIASWIIAHFPQHTNYIEPFAGAASVLLQKGRVPCEVLNDLDCRLINLFRVLQDKKQADELARRCSLTPFARAEFELSYEETEDPIDQVRRLIIRSFFGYGSKSCVSITKNGFRSRRADTNSPAVDWASWPTQIEMFVERLRGVVIENQDATKVIERYDRADALFYVDPPYVHSERNLNQGSYLYELTDEDHRELAEALHNVEGYVIISGYPSKLYDEIYNLWPKIERKAYADQASPRAEVLWLSPRTAEALEKEKLPLLCGTDKDLFEHV
ncbi:DNA adenine methylase [Maridesulfovibrio bastinii]|uniref:DNA adenine methylase n=1 Tax=Maridesulfovibrio bastinii TaxID=47157 RepID=UPI0004224F8C|nr:DNA adenine methylase [Maridesulfovibrio bastinii]